MARKETMAERNYCKMKKDIHPEYRPVVFMDTTTGYKFLSGSTKYSNETVEFEGETYPLIRVEISSAFTALLNCAEVGRRNRILTNFRFLSHSQVKYIINFLLTRFFCLQFINFSWFLLWHALDTSLLQVFSKFN